MVLICPVPLRHIMESLVEAVIGRVVVPAEQAEYDLARHYLSSQAAVAVAAV